MKMESVEKKKKDIMDSLQNQISGISIDDIKSNGFTIRSGSKILKLSVLEEISIDNIEDDIRKELSKKLSDRLQKIGETIKKKLDDMSSFVSSIKKEYEDEKEKLERRLESNEIMPNITYEHARQGLSLTKGSNGRLVWMFQSVYWPKYIDNRVIDSSYSKRLINHIIITVETLGDSVMKVGVKKPIGLGDFNHFHTNCWGHWKHNPKWKTPDDIINICKEAEVVLETINTHSLASHSPEGLMRVSTLEKHSTPMSEAEITHTSNRRSENIGISTGFTRNNIWSV